MLAYVGKLSFASIMLWYGSCYLCKISVLLLYRDIFPTRNMLVLTKIVCVLTFACAVAVLVGTPLVLNPVSKRWTHGKLPPAEITNATRMAIFGDVATLSTDILIFSLPLKSLFNLRVKWPKKVGIISTFTLGFLACIIALVRTGLDYTPDSSKEFECVMNGLEPSIAIIAVCVPTLRPLLYRKRYTYKVTTIKEIFSTKPSTCRTLVNPESTVDKTEDASTTKVDDAVR
ncbi:uncharacterized protein BCR38DRAFT_526502 [Pseudomassariella vexata]|uniref:Rhodopsin domain-containing protein n=1 Tax=Pseudomassariella vexata TaxID=1141098 RepID=A0A1Y2DPC9_9PEZI|nr:uncharacterized protein BCR38DRAFT_526502 [Pseudomassariella vexata]ORY61004.1 hypothetical protein BCR38DRAFT_526502 [Pseudomassariella vexata]